jgi:hypothetical protein
VVVLAQHSLDLISDLGPVRLGLGGGEALTLATCLTLTLAACLTLTAGLTLSLTTRLALTPATRLTSTLTACLTLALAACLTLALTRLGHLASFALDARRHPRAALQLLGLSLVGPDHLPLLVGQTLAILVTLAALALLATLALLPPLTLLAGHRGLGLPASTLRTHRRNRGNDERDDAEDRDCLGDMPHGSRSLLA